MRGGGHLYDAPWSLTSPAGHLLLRPWRDLVVDSEHGTIDVFVQNGGGLVTALRPLSTPDTGRVKAYAKQAHDGILAPVLLWWVSPMDGYVVLDGHDRLAACLAHEIEPPVLVLDTTPEGATDELVEWLSAEYTKTVELVEAEIARGRRGAEVALERVHRGFAARLAAGATRSRTRAWVLPGGVEEWRRQVALVDHRWLEQVDPVPAE